MIIPNICKNKSHVPNHQPVKMFWRNHRNPNMDNIPSIACAVVNSRQQRDDTPPMSSQQFYPTWCLDTARLHWIPECLPRINKSTLVDKNVGGSRNSQWGDWNGSHPNQQPFDNWLWWYDIYESGIYTQIYMVIFMNPGLIWLISFKDQLLISVKNIKKQRVMWRCGMFIPTMISGWFQSLWKRLEFVNWDDDIPNDHGKS